MDLGARRRLGLASTCLVLALAFIALVPLASSPAQGSTEERCSRFARESRARQQIVTGHGSTTVVIGDSYAAGLGLRRPEQNWASELPGRVHVFGFAGSGLSRGASPCRSVAYADRARQALALNPRLVVVEGGLNDFDQPANEIRAGFHRLLADVGHRRVLVVGPPPAPARHGRAARVDAILRSEAARSGTAYLSMIGQQFGYLHDGLHLTLAGHQRFGALVAARTAQPR